MNYTIMTDTSANLPDEIIRKYDLQTIPFFYCPPEHPEGIPCPRSTDFDGTAYYNAIRRGSTITTAQINQQQYIDAMEPLLAAGQDILFVGMSSGISGAYHSAYQAAKQLAEPLSRQTDPRGRQPVRVAGRGTAGAGSGADAGSRR